MSNGKKKVNCYLFSDRFVAVSEKKVLGKSKINQLLSTVDIIEGNKEFWYIFQVFAEKSEGFVLKIAKVDIELGYIAPKDKEWV
jgi:hypothetical protein